MSTEDEFGDLLSELAAAPPVSVVDPFVGQHLGPYLVISPLGSGGEGEVYRAKDERLDREVALKVLPRNARALEEARHSARVVHHRVAQIFDVGEGATHAWIAFELVSGPSVGELWQEQGFDREACWALALGLADALGAVHGAGLVHGDLSPGNVLWRERGPVLVDFGLASSANTAEEGATGEVRGTEGFVAPELLSGSARTAASDVFAFGALLLRCPNLPPGLRRLAERCVCTEPEGRPRGADLRGELEALRRRRRWVVPIVGVVAITAVVGLGFAWRAPRSSTESTAPSAASVAPRAVPERLTFYGPDVELGAARVAPRGGTLAVIENDEVWLVAGDGVRRERLDAPDGAGAPLSVDWLDADALVVAYRAGSYRHSIADGSAVGEPVRLSVPLGYLEAASSGVVVVWGSEGLLMGRPSALEAAPVVGAVLGFALSPGGRRLAMLTLGDSEQGELWVWEPGHEATMLHRSRRLLGRSGLIGMVWRTDEALIVSMAAASADAPAQLVQTAANRWAPRPLATLERFAARLSIDEANRLHFEWPDHQSDTMIAAWDGSVLGQPRRVSESARDDRPVSWAGTGELIAVLRRGREHRSVCLPRGGGQPAACGPGGWVTWPHWTRAGWVAFGMGENEESELFVWEPESGHRRGLQAVSGSLGELGAGRPPPRSGALDCTLDGRCVMLLRGASEVVLHAFDLRQTPTVHRRVPWPGLGNFYDVAVDAAFERAAATDGEGLCVLDLVTGETRRTEVSGASSLQYLARAPGREGPGWIISGMSNAEQPYALFFVGPEGQLRRLRSSERDWFAHPVVSPDGRTLAFSSMRLRSDLYALSL